MQFLKPYDIYKILDLKPLVNILGPPYGMLRCNNLVCVG